MEKKTVEYNIVNIKKYIVKHYQKVKFDLIIPSKTKFDFWFLNQVINKSKDKKSKNKVKVKIKVWIKKRGVPEIEKDIESKKISHY